MPLNKAVDLATGAANIAGQLNRQLGANANTVVVDPMLDGRTGQQTDASALMQNIVSERLPSGGSTTRQIAKVLNKENVDSARLIATGVITALTQPDQYSMNVAVADRNTGAIVASAATQFIDKAVSNAPKRFYRDSPTIAVDQAVTGYIRTAQALRGGRADEVYLKQLPAAAVLAEAQQAYDAGRFQDSLDLYSAAGQKPEGTQLRTMNGLYLSYHKLHRDAEAEEAFKVIVDYSLAQGSLAVMFLFEPGSTTFWRDREVTEAYPMWLRQIASVAAHAGRCLKVVGNTSHSGPAALNLTLSLQRANVIRDRMVALAPDLRRRLKTEGVGFSKNLVGTGVDDATDAVDRRVEFQVAQCEQAIVEVQPPLAATAPHVPSTLERSLGVAAQ